MVVDCNHDNSGKRPLEQLRIAKEVLDSCRRNEAIDGIVRGFMVESYLEDGNQPVDGGVYGKSITDRASVGRRPSASCWRLPTARNVTRPHAALLHTLGCRVRGATVRMAAEVRPRGMAGLSEFVLTAYLSPMDAHMEAGRMIARRI